MAVERDRFFVAGKYEFKFPDELGRGVKPARCLKRKKHPDKFNYQQRRVLSAEKIGGWAASITGKRRINFACPAINSSREILQLGETEMFELRNRIQAPNSMMAIDNNLLGAPVLDFIDAARDFAERNQF